MTFPPLADHSDMPMLRSLMTSRVQVRGLLPSLRLGLADRTREDCYSTGETFCFRNDAIKAFAASVSGMPGM